MSTPQCITNGKPVTLHAFFKDGFWHWGITIPRESGCGFQVIAYSERGFTLERDAISNGNLALKHIVDDPFADTARIWIPLASVVEDRRRYMHERLRCAMARLIRCDEATAETARRWVTAWGALIGEQHFDKALRIRRRSAPKGN
jgi:hypothetical protein